MIPTHNSDQTKRNEIVAVRLSALTNYDFGMPHRHGYYEFFYFSKGGGSHMIDFQEFPIEDHSIHIVAPGRIHQVKRELDSSGFVFLFELPALSAPSDVADFFVRQGSYEVSEMSPTFVLPKEYQELAKAQTDLLWNSVSEGARFIQLILQNAIQNMALKCMDLEPDSLIRGKETLYSSFRKLVLENFTKVKQVSAYAEMLGVSVKTLNQQIKKYSGQSASQVIQKQTLLESKRLLQTGLSVKETAYTLNFQDPAHFSKFFKTKMGISPSAFQKVHP